ncbi:MAG: serine protease [Bacteriovorax sp.]|jgi:V8-like Glu-specific endopeptidase
MSRSRFDKTFFALASLLTLSSGISVEAKIINLDENTDVIYGEDDRHEASEYADLDFVEKSRSVAIRVPNRRLSDDREDDTLINFPHRKLKSAIPQLCSTERFAEEFSVGDCSGFLVAPNILVTAGHCMSSESECTSNKWVFDFDQDTTAFKKSDVYGCKKIITQKSVSSEKEVNDYAVIELDREVLGRAPLKHRKIGRVMLGTPLLIIGHPLGLPLKIADGAKVSRMNDTEREKTIHSWLMRANYFTANLDSYGGNSGSPVFNKKSGKVEGILIQGADDFVFNNETQCLESVHLSNSHKNTYEKVMRITKVPGL